MRGIQGRAVVGRLDFGDVPGTGKRTIGFRSGLRLALPSDRLRGPEKFLELDLRRRRAQIRARRALGLR